MRLNLLATSSIIAGLLGLSCSFEFRPPSGIVGSYEISADCLLQVNETDALAECEPEGKMVRVTIGDDELIFDEITLEESETYSECWIERVCTKTYVGAASRESRSSTPYDGRFSRLAGDWTGKLTMLVSCAKEEPKSSAPPWCQKTGSYEVTYDFEASISDHEAQISWSATTGAAGEFQALETKGGVRVADTFYPMLGTE